jgi:DNA-binding response OmpR family regulator
MARILIVDDEALIAMMVEDWLSDMGHTAVGPAHDLDSALALVEADLSAAILDLTLGAQVSYPVAGRLRELGVPFAFATGHGRDFLTPEFRDAPQLPKPFEFETFRSLVEGLLAAPGSKPARPG